MKRSLQTIGRYLANPRTYGKGKRSGQRKKTTKREDRMIKLVVVNEKMSLSRIKSVLNLRCCKTTVWDRLVRGPNVTFGRHKSKPVLSKLSKEKRLEFALEKI